MPEALSEAVFNAAFTAPMHDVTAEAEAIIDIWPYVDSLSDADLRDLQPHDVEYVYRDAGGHFEHVLIGTCRENYYLAIVIDLKKSELIGHHLLDLAKLYGLSAADSSDR